MTGGDSPDQETGIEDKGEEPQSVIYQIAKQKVRERVEAPRGIFTKSDREFLCGEKEYEYKQSRSNKLRDIRERATNAILDLQFLLSLRPDQRTKILSDLDHGEFHESIASLIAFAYIGLDENVGAIEQITESGLYRAANWSKQEGDEPIEGVDVDINLVFEYDVDEIYARFQSGKAAELTPAEIGVLVREGKLEADDYDDLERKDDERQLDQPGHSDELPWYHEVEEH